MLACSGEFLMTDPAPKVKNRRIYLRRNAKASTKATCRKGTLDLGPNLALGVLDLSETGVRLRLRQPLDAKQEVAVTLEGANHHRPLRIVGRVAWCVATAAGEHLAGIAFDKRLPYVELFKLT
jgi:PilZ domain